MRIFRLLSDCLTRWPIVACRGRRGRWGTSSRPVSGGSGIPSGGALSLPPSAAAASAVNVSSSTASASGVGPAGNTAGGSGTNAAGGAVQSTNVTLACPPAAASIALSLDNPCLDNFAFVCGYKF